MPKWTLQMKKVPGFEEKPQNLEETDASAAENMGNFAKKFFPPRHRRWSLNFYCLQVVFCALLIWVVIMNVGLYFLYSGNGSLNENSAPKGDKQQSDDGLTFTTLEGVVEDFLNYCDAVGLSNIVFLHPEFFLQKSPFRWSNFAQKKPRILSFLLLDRNLPFCKPGLEKLAENLNAQMLCKEDRLHALISTPAVTFHLVSSGDKIQNSVYKIKRLNDTEDIAEKLWSVGITGNAGLLFLNHEAILEAWLFDSLKKAELDGVMLNMPQDMDIFSSSLWTSRLIPCDDARSKEFYANFPEMQQLIMLEDAKEFRRKTRQILYRVVEVLRSLRVPFWISSGTLLGWFRQCDVIPYSEDVDIGVFARDHRDEIVPALENQGFQMRMKFGMVQEGLQYSFVHKEMKLDVYFFYGDGPTHWNWATKPETGDRYKYIFPHFSLCWAEFLELFLRVPCPTLPYVEANYGKSWFEPIKEWDWKTSPPNAEYHGKWGHEILNETVQVFEIH